MPSVDRRGLTELSARDAARRIKAKRLSPVELVEACLARIHELDPKLQAWVHVDEAGALATAREREREARRGKIRGRLHGVPIGVKDIFDVAGMPTRAGAATFAHRLPTEDAASVARLRAEGAIILGKTHTTQFAYRDPAPTRNPWNLEHTPGGSSAGSAAAVAARMVPLALGSQTVGSVLRPAAYCGVVGLKGSHGLVPIEGVIPLAWSFDHVGSFARSVADAALAHLVLIGCDSFGPTNRAPKLALVPELLVSATADVAEQVRKAAQAFAGAGARIVEVELPRSYADLPAAGQVVLEAEAAAYHAVNFAKRASEYGRGIRTLIEAGLTRSAVEYVSANRTRLEFRRDAMARFSEHDALLTATAPATAPAGLASTGDASLCAPWSWAGLPAISLPSRVGRAGLPHAIQLVRADDRDDIHLLQVAAWCENVLAFSAVPPL